MFSFRHWRNRSIPNRSTRRFRPFRPRWRRLLLLKVQRYRRALPAVRLQDPPVRTTWSECPFRLVSPCRRPISLLTYLNKPFRVTGRWRPNGRKNCRRRPRSPPTSTSVARKRCPTTVWPANWWRIRSTLRRSWHLAALAIFSINGRKGIRRSESGRPAAKRNIHIRRYRPCRRRCRWLDGLKCHRQEWRLSTKSLCPPGRM